MGATSQEAALRHGQEACLLSNAEMRGGPRAWAELSDPFPAWRD